MARHGRHPTFTLSTKMRRRRRVCPRGSSRRRMPAQFSRCGRRARDDRPKSIRRPSGRPSSSCSATMVHGSARCRATCACGSCRFSPRASLDARDPLANDESLVNVFPDLLDPLLGIQLPRVDPRPLHVLREVGVRPSADRMTRMPRSRRRDDGVGSLDCGGWRRPTSLDDRAAGLQRGREDRARAR